MMPKVILGRGMILLSLLASSVSLVTSGGSSTLLQQQQQQQQQQQRNKMNHTPLSIRRKRTFLMVTSADAGAALEDETPPSKLELFRRRGMAASLFATFFAVMGAKCALPSVFSQLTAPGIGLSFVGMTSKPQSLMSQQLTYSTIAIALGKLVLGPVIDRFGGVLSLQASLSLLMILMIVIASANHFIAFALAWLLVDFVFSSCWAGCINAVHQSFPEREWAGRIGMIAAAARTGNACAFVLFAAVLQWSSKHLGPNAKSWRLVFGASAALQIIPLMLLGYFGRMKPDLPRRTPESSKTLSSKTGISSIQLSFAILKREATKPEFWLHLISRSVLMVFASFLLFVPTLMSQVYQMSASGAAQVGSVLALGCLLSVTTCSQLYSKYSKRNKILLTMALLGSATLCAMAQLAHVSGLLALTPALSTMSMFLWGFSFAVPFYIPPSMFALARGGKESSATIADVFDIVGFGLLASFNGYVASIPHSHVASWIPTFQLLTGCSITSLISLSLAIFFE